MLLMRLPSALVQLDLAAEVKCLGLAERQDRIGCSTLAQTSHCSRSAMPETVAVIRRVLATGSSFPSVVETSAGELYVQKLSGAGPGRRALATEYLALKIARNFGLTVPDAHVIDLPRDFPWQTGTDEFHEAVQRSAGPNLGVAFIDNARDLAAAELAELPRAIPRASRRHRRPAAQRRSHRRQPEYHA